MTAYRWHDPARTLPRRRLADRIRAEVGPEDDSWDSPEPVKGRGWAVYLLKPCGTEAAYKRHLRAGENACPKCVAGHGREGAIRAADRRARRARAVAS